LCYNLKQKSNGRKGQKIFLHECTKSGSTPILMLSGPKIIHYGKTLMLDNWIPCTLPSENVTFLFNLNNITILFFSLQEHVYLSERTSYYV